MLFTLADARPDGLLVVQYPYFEREEPLVLDEPGTYVATEATFTHTVTHEWNHGLAEVITAVMDAGLRLIAIEEHDTIPWEALSGQTENLSNGEWRLPHGPDRVAMSYTLQAVKPGV